MGIHKLLNPALGSPGTPLLYESAHLNAPRIAYCLKIPVIRIGYLIVSLQILASAMLRETNTCMSFIRLSQYPLFPHVLFAVPGTPKKDAWMNAFSKFPHEFLPSSDCTLPSERQKS
jgi:hypothetical protein